ncbi:MAG: hypothetical protein MOB07_30900 [Acidobacteria bacterium]|nr:hypothetical protein [Acidobacteriota bacterium]
MTSVQRKFAAGLISLFVIPATNYIGRTTRLTPDDSAEPIYEFTQAKPALAPTPSRTADTAHDPDIPPMIRKKVDDEAKRRGFKIVDLRVEFKKGNDSKPFILVSGKVSASKVSAARVKEFNAQVNKYTAGKYRVESNVVTDRSNSAPAR